MTALDLDAYLARVGHTGGTAPTLGTLRALHLAHATAIPFENLDVLLGRVPALDAAGLGAKLLRGGRGGWCFEHNGLLRLALEALGFRTTGLAARVVFNVPADVVRPRSHMVLVVHLDDGDWLADVGFGGLTMTGPIRLVAGVAQETPHGPFRLVDEGDTLRMEALAGEWRALYRFDRAPQLAIDYELPNWYLSTHPASHFRAGLIAARPARDGRRHTLRDALLATRWPDGRVEERALGSAAELRAALEDVIDLRVPAEATAALEAAVARTAVTRTAVTSP